MRTTLLALGLTLALASCGGGDPATLTDDGYAALGKGDASTALAKFEDALETLPESDPVYMRAKMGHIKALVQAAPEEAEREFLALAEQSDLSASDYRVIGTQLSEKKAYEEATVVLDAGFKKYPDDASFKTAIDQVAAAAKDAGDTGALDKLGGLGYIGE